MSESQGNEFREAMESLNESNRILIGARMLTKSKTLTQQQTFEIVERFQRHIERRGISLSQVAKQIRYAESVISQWRSNVYKGDMDGVTRAVNDWIERDARRAEVARPRGEIKTWCAETMRTVSHISDKHCLMAAIVAPSGSGKSMVLQALTEEMRGIYISVDPAITARELLRKLAVSLGRKLERGSRGLLLSYIVGELRGSKRILFFDEAQHLGKAVAYLRAIHDQANVPIVMAGTADILGYVDDRADGRGQLARRTIVCNIMEEVYNAEQPGGQSMGRDLFTLSEVREFFASRQIKLTDGGLSLMWSLACLPDHGTLGLVELLAKLALEANRGIEVLDRPHIIKAANAFLGRARAKHVQTIAERHEQRQVA